MQNLPTSSTAQPVSIKTMEQVQKEHFTEVWKLCKNSPTIVCHNLKISRATVYRLAKKYGCWIGGK